MELALITYFVLQLDRISSSIGGMLVLLALLFIIGSFIWSYYRDVDGLRSDVEEYQKRIDNKYRQFFIVIVPAFFFLSAVSAFLPSSENAKYIIGAYGVQTAASAISQNEEAKRIASKSVAAAEGLLDSLAEKKKPDKK